MAVSKLRRVRLGQARLAAVVAGRGRCPRGSRRRRWAPTAIADELSGCPPRPCRPRHGRRLQADLLIGANDQLPVCIGVSTRGLRERCEVVSRSPKQVVPVQIGPAADLSHGQEPKQSGPAGLRLRVSSAYRCVVG